MFRTTQGLLSSKRPKFGPQPDAASYADFNAIKKTGQNFPSDTALNYIVTSVCKEGRVGEGDFFTYIDLFYN